MAEPRFHLVSACCGKGCCKSGGKERKIMLDTGESIVEMAKIEPQITVVKPIAKMPEDEPLKTKVIIISPRVCDKECVQIDPDSCCAKKIDCEIYKFKCCDKKPELADKDKPKTSELHASGIGGKKKELPTQTSLGGLTFPIAKCRVTFENDRDVFYTGEPLKGTVHYEFGGPTYIAAIQLCASGKRSFDFSITVPKDLPSSFNYDEQSGYVKYTLRVKLLRCCRTDDIDKVKEIEVFVVNPVDLNEQESFLRNVFQVSLQRSLNGGDLYVTVTSPKSGYVAGESMPLKIVAKNGTKKDIDKIVIAIRMIATYMVEDDPENVNNNKVYKDERTNIIDCAELGRVPACTKKKFDHEFIIPKVPPSKVEKRVEKPEEDEKDENVENAEKQEPKKVTHFVAVNYDMNVKCFTKGCFDRPKILEASQQFRIGTVPLGDVKVYIVPNDCDRHNDNDAAAIARVELPLTKQMESNITKQNVQVALINHYGIHSKLFSNKRVKDEDENEYFNETKYPIRGTSYPVFRIEHGLILTGNSDDLQTSSLDLLLSNKDPPNASGNISPSESLTDNPGPDDNMMSADLTDTKKGFCASGQTEREKNQMAKCTRLTAKNQLTSDDLLGMLVANRGQSCKDERERNTAPCCNRITKAVPVACDSKTECVEGCKNITKDST